MNLLDFFKQYLITRDSAPSKATVKNYLSDIRKFVLWYEMTYHTRFEPQAIRASMIAKFREDKLARIRRGHSVIGGMSASSVERYTSSLRKFFSCLKENGLISTSPFDLPNEAKNNNQEDKWQLKAFKNSLFIANTSDLTIKNYIIDIRQFLSWVEEVTKDKKTSYLVDRRGVLEKITPELTEEYKYRLLDHLKLSPVSINRKLSSLRKYLTWASDQGLLASAPLISSNLSEGKISPTKSFENHQNPSEIVVNTALFTQEQTSITREKSYSRFPPLRLFQKMGVAGSVLLDFGLIIPLAFLAEKVDYAKWAITGQKLFITKASDLPSEAIKAASVAIPVDPLGKIIGAVPNFKKSFYAPLSVSTEAMPVHKRVIHILRYTRPKWYKKYHAYAFVHYIHFALLIIFMTGVGMYVYRSYMNVPQQQSDVLAANVSPPRILSFQGRLTDSNDTPITTKTNLRFGMYNSQTASGSALLWQEVDSVTPDENGIFSVILGNGTQIPQSLFGQNAALYVGISVGSDAELVPRQQIATVAYATNAELLQGMPAITQPNAGTSNVVLALDSSGNLTIGGTASPTFQATGGTFTLSGNVLNLTTSGNGNVVVAPGGTGVISLQSPIQNLGNNNTMPGVSGAVQFSDNVGIYNTGVQTALSIYQTSSGNVITASQSGTTVFSVNNSGQGYFAQALGVGQQNPSSMLYVTSGGDATSATFNSTASTNTIFSFLYNGNQFASLNRNSNGDTQLNTNNTQNILLMPGGNVGIGTSTPSSFPVQVVGHVGPNADNVYNLGSSSMRWSNIYGVNTTTQNLTIPGLTNAGGVLYTNSSGAVSQTATGTSGDCLISQGSNSPAWSPCAAASGSVWTVANGAISPLYLSADLLVGANSTASAKFAVLNVSSGTPVAYINGNVGVGTTTPGANVDIVGTLRASGLITANGGISFGSGQTLTIGGDTIGDFVGTGLQLNGTTLETTLGTSVNLTSEVTGILPIANGGTNSTATPTAGGISYGTGAAYAFTLAGTLGQVLLSSGAGAPTWADASSVGTNYWQLANGALAPANSTNDIVLGSNATASALIKLGGTPNANSYFNTGGNIGIGTTTPNQKLTIVDSSDVNARISVGDSFLSGIFFDDNQGASVTDGNWFYFDGTLDKYLFTGRKSSSSKNIMTFNNVSGNVGFGTISPNASLYVTRPLSFGANGKALAIFDQIENQDIFTASASGTTRFVIQNNGNVGIGTATPTEGHLELRNTTTSPIFTINGAASGQPQIRFAQNSTVRGFLFYDNANGLMTLNRSGNNGEGLSVNSSGNVGIGTSSIGDNLEVAGTIDASTGYKVGNVSGATANNLNCVNVTGGIITGAGACSSSPSSDWTIINGVLTPNNATLDLTLGGQSTASAKFAVLNLNSSGPAIATISGNLTVMTRDGAGGNVGIGLTSPISKLGIAGIDNKDTGPIISLGGSTANQTESGRIRFLEDETGLFGYTGAYIHYDGNANVLNLGVHQTQDSLTSSDVNSISITRLTGNVGIGTTAPLGKLNVEGKATGNALAIFNETGNQDIFTASASGTTRFVIQNSGNVAIGTLQPTVSGGALQIGVDLGNTFVANFFHDGNNTNRQGIRLQVGADNAAGTNVLMDFRDGDGTAQGSITFTSGTTAYNTTSDRRVKENIVATTKGLTELMMIQVRDFAFVADPTHATKTGFVAQELYNVYPEAVTIPNDPNDIWSVDYSKLTPLLVRGIQQQQQQIENLEVKINADGNITSDTFSLQREGEKHVVRKNGQIISSIDILAQAVVGTIQTGALNATEISAESITIAGMSLRDYILSIVEQTSNEPTIISPVDGKLAVHVISPLASDADIQLELEKDTLSITDTSGKKAASIDNKGNATFSGTLVAKDASIAGTLKADKVETDELALSEEGLIKLKDKLATNSATIVNNITNVYQSATPSATPTVSLSPTPSTSSSASSSSPTLTAQTDYADISSMSGILAYVPSLSADFATFTKGLMSFGPSSLSDTSITGNLTVNGNMILAENSIDVLGADLQIQPLRQGSVSFMSGRIKIDIDGNMSVEGDATFNKKVAIKGFLETNFVSPIPGDDLVIKLPSVSGHPEDLGSQFVIQNASGSGVLRVNQLGDLIASGSGQFRNLSAETFKIIRGAQADTSLTETVATASAGTATIGKNQTERTVYSPFVKEDSLIYITPSSNTKGLTPYIARQTAEDKDNGDKGSFTIQLPDLAPSDIKINWWIVN